jgi:hypothetical protein
LVTLVELEGAEGRLRSPTFTAAILSSVAARLEDRRVFELSSRPPEILFREARAGPKVDKEVSCCRNRSWCGQTR